MREFRQSFWVMFGFVLAWAFVLIAAAVAGLSWWMLSLGVAPPLWVLAFSAPAGVAVAAILVWVATAHFTIRLDGNGIRAFDMWGRERVVAWAAIRSARNVNVGGMRYVRVDATDGGAPLWVPKSLRDRGAFDAALTELAPLDNPLRTMMAASA